MARSFRSWTVLAHRPIEKLSDKLWMVRGTMPTGSARRVMVVARRADGRLLVHNAIALDEPEMAELEAFGEPAFLLVPNAYHRQDAFIWKQRYPSMRVHCPSGARARVGKEVAVDGSFAELPADPGLEAAELDGCKGREGFLLVRSGEGTTLVLNDAIMNQPPLGGMLGFLFGPTGRPSVPRAFRWMFVKDQRALGAHLVRLAATPGLDRVIVSHGREITDHPAAALRAAAAALG